MSNDQTQINLKLSQALKDAIERAAFDADMSTLAFIRMVLASAIDYDLKQDEQPRKVRRFATREEYREFYKLKAREDRALARRLIDAHKKGLIQLDDVGNK